MFLRDNCPQKTVVKEIGIGSDRVSAWYEYFRDVVAEKRLVGSNILKGIDGDERAIDVEIDKSILQTKINRGRIGDPMWVFWYHRKKSTQMFLVPVINRTRETLMEVIIWRIRPGPRIFSNKWNAYRVLYYSSIYVHAEVNNWLSFVNLNENDIHTQNVECMRNHAKT